MGVAYNRAREAIERVKKFRDKCLVIHYSCQSLYDDREGLSPRIANIVVKNIDNDQTVSFAISVTAEKLHIPREDIPANFDQLELELLREFYDFVGNHGGHLWLHWNMINIQYGFETLSHRYYVLSGKNPPAIDVESRINIAAVLYGLYGDGYVSVPHMPKLMVLNGGPRKDFVAGADEVGLFNNGEYARLHASTVAKVRFFGDVVDLVIDRKLRTEKSTAGAKLERAMDHVAAKVIGLLAAIYTIVDLTLKFTGQTNWPWTR